MRLSGGVRVQGNHGKTPGRAGTRRRLLTIAMMALAVVALTTTRAGAQAVYGSIGGTITDNSGGVLPGVTVTITSLERKTVDSVVTNESGFFVKDRLLPGRCE